jgi:hypothetical protein
MVALVCCGWCIVVLALSLSRDTEVFRGCCGLVCRGLVG